MNKEYMEAKARYESGVAKSLQKHKERKEVFATGGGIPLERLYGPEVCGDSDYMREIGFPGEYPFTRGVQSTMYRGRFWTMRQYAGFASAEESNERYRYLLASGTTGLSVAFDLPTQIGFDSDDPMAQGVIFKYRSAFSQFLTYKYYINVGKLPYCIYIPTIQFSFSGISHIQKFPYIKRPYLIFVIVSVYNGDGIGFFHIGT